jgi:MoxR-like ATPase
MPGSLRRAARDRRCFRVGCCAALHGRHHLRQRFPSRYKKPLSKWIQVGASPRGSLALDRCARVRAWLDGQSFVTPDHIRAVMHDCLRHRLILTYEALSEGVTADQAIDKIASLVAPV